MINPLEVEEQEEREAEVEEGEEGEEDLEEEEEEAVEDWEEEKAEEEGLKEAGTRTKREKEGNAWHPQGVTKGRGRRERLALQDMKKDVRQFGGRIDIQGRETLSIYQFVIYSCQSVDNGQYEAAQGHSVGRA